MRSNREFSETAPSIHTRSVALKKAPEAISVWRFSVEPICEGQVLGSDSLVMFCLKLVCSEQEHGVGTSKTGIFGHALRISGSSDLAM